MWGFYKAWRLGAMENTGMPTQGLRVWSPSHQLKFLNGDMYWFFPRKMLPCISAIHCTSGSRGGAHPAPPPNVRGPMFFYSQNANFSQYFLRSLLILSIILIEIWPKKKPDKNDFYFSLQHFQWFSTVNCMPWCRMGLSEMSECIVT